MNVQLPVRLRPIAAEGESWRQPMRGACCVHHHLCRPRHPDADVMSWILKQVAWEALQSASPSASSSALPFRIGHKKPALKGKKILALCGLDDLGVNDGCQAFELGLIPWFHLFLWKDNSDLAFFGLNFPCGGGSREWQPAVSPIMFSAKKRKEK